MQFEVFKSHKFDLNFYFRKNLPNMFISFWKIFLSTWLIEPLRLFHFGNFSYLHVISNYTLIKKVRVVQLEILEALIWFQPFVNAVICDRNVVPSCENCSINALSHCTDLMKVINETQVFDVVLDFSAYEPKWVSSITLIS